MIKKNSKNSAFTLAELLVAMSLFIIIATVAVGIFVNSIKGERRLISLMGMQNNVSSALEQMAREMRGGYIFQLGPLNCAEDKSSGLVGSDSISFLSPDGNSSVNYSLSSGSLTRNSSPITSSNVNVSNLCFIVSQKQIGDPTMYTSSPANSCNPWRITILLTMSPGYTNPLGINSIPVETTVSSRVLPKDIPRFIKSSYPQYAGCK